MNKFFGAGGLIAVFLLLFTIFLVINNQTNIAENNLKTIEPNVQEKNVNNESFNSNKLSEKLSLISNNFSNIDTAISVQSISDSSSSNINGYVSLEAASVNKVPVAIYAFNKIDNNELSLNSDIYGQQLGDLLEAMLVDSNNSAWETLISYFGLQNIKKYMESLNVETFYSQDKNYISAQDSATILKAAYSGALSKESLQYLNKLMSNSYTGPITLPEEYANTANKAGWLEDRYHIIGILEQNGKTVSFAIFSQAKDGYDYYYKDSKEFIIQTLNAIYSSLNES